MARVGIHQCLQSLNLRFQGHAGTFQQHIALTHVGETMLRLRQLGMLMHHFRLQLRFNFGETTGHTFSLALGDLRLAKIPANTC